LEAVNVLSTIELLHLSVTSSRPRLLYVSGGRQWFSEEEDDEDVAKELATSIGYSQTKFVSEVVVKRASCHCERGYSNLAVVKPGLVIGTPHEGTANIDTSSSV
jgi:thioester reductase-like protein